MAARKKPTRKSRKKTFPPIRLEWRDPAELAANPLNWRTHPPEQITAITDAISLVGWAGACLFNEATGRLIDGHARQKVAIAQGTAKIPVLVGSWTEEQERIILATLDPLSAKAEADSAKLTELLNSFETGSESLDALLAELAEDAGPALPEPGGGGDEFDATPQEGPTRTKTGDLWIIGGVHRLLVGDCTDAGNVALLMNGQKMNLIVTSPPYNQDIGNFSKSGMHKETKWIDNTVKTAYPDNLPEDEYQSRQVAAIEVWKMFLTEDASIFYNHKNRYRDKQVVNPWHWLAKTGAKVRQEIIWAREGSVTMNARMFNPSDERIFWLYFGTQFYFSDIPEHRVWSSVWKINSHKDVGVSEHSCAFPLELPTRCIAACCPQDGNVFEPYCGSGTTMIASHRLGKRCFAFEIEPRSADVILRRCEAEGLSVELSRGE